MCDIGSDNTPQSLDKLGDFLSFLVTIFFWLSVPRRDLDFELLYVHVESRPVREVIGPLTIRWAELERLQQGSGKDVHLRATKDLAHTAPVDQFDVLLQYSMNKKTV